MVKRFVDTEIWGKDWFLQLTDAQKLLTKFVFDNCDCAGIYEISWSIIRAFFTTEITIEDFKKIKQLKFLNDNTVFIEDFVKFQCGVKNIKDLNPNNNAHKGVIKRLEKYNLMEVAPSEPLVSPSLAPAQPLTSPTLGAQEKEKEKEKDKEKEKENNSSSLVLSSSCEEQTQKLYGEYRNVCLSNTQYGKLLGLCLSQKLLDELLNAFSIAIEVGKEKPYMDALPNAHYERLRSYHNYRMKHPENFREDNKASPTKSAVDRWVEQYESEAKG